MSPKRILYVYVRGGAPLGYAFPRIAACGELHVLELAPLPTVNEEAWRPCITSVIPLEGERPEGDALVDLIVEQAERIAADAVFTLSEWILTAVADAAERLGMRGVGTQSPNSRDKRRMREIWEAAGIPVPAFRRVATEEQLRAAFHELQPPMLLKSAWGSGSIGQLVIEREDEIPSVLAEARQTVNASFDRSFMELHHTEVVGDFLVEEIIQGSTEGWFDRDSGYGDYLSVEGIVSGGVYYPLCITSRLPTIPPFTELANMAPAGMAEPLQRRIEEASRKIVDALGISYAGTHTELKLTKDGVVVPLEAAARPGGVMVTKEVETVYGLDIIGMCVRDLLGEPIELPERMLTDADANGAAGSLSVIATDSGGTPWRHHPVWDPRNIDWSGILSPGTTIEASPGLGLPFGSPMPPYRLSGGGSNYAGIWFLRAKDAPTLLRDSYSVLDNLERALTAAEGSGDGRR